jgi:hypothetical protein
MENERERRVSSVTSWMGKCEERELLVMVKLLVSYGRDGVKFLCCFLFVQEVINKNEFFAHSLQKADGKEGREEKRRRGSKSV